MVGAGSGSPRVPVHVPVSGLQQRPAGLCTSSARWDVLERSEGLWGPPLHLWGLVMLPSSKWPCWPSTAEVEQRRVGYGLGGPVAARCRLVFPGGCARRAGALAARACRGAGCGKQLLPTAGSSRAGDSGSRGCAGGTASTWGAEGGGGRKPLLSFMLCWALPASRILRQRGDCCADFLWGRQGGRGAATPSLPRCFGEAAAGQEVTRCPGPAARGLPGRARHASFRRARSAAAPAFQGAVPTAAPGEQRLLHLQPRLFLPSLPSPHCGALGDGEGRNGDTSCPASPALARCPPWHGKAPRQQRERRGGGDPAVGHSCARLESKAESLGGISRPPTLGLGWAGLSDLPGTAAGRVFLPVSVGGLLGAAPALRQPKVGGPGGDAGPGVGARRECGVL